MPATSRLKISLSVCFSRADPARAYFSGNILQYVEQSIAHWLTSSGAMVVMEPCPSGSTQRGDVTCAHYAQRLNALVLNGGADVWSGSHGETPLQENGAATGFATTTTRRWWPLSRRYRCSASAGACSGSTWPSAQRSTPSFTGADTIDDAAVLRTS